MTADNGLVSAREEEFIGAENYASIWLEFQQKQRKLPGVSAAVARNGKMILTDAYGYANSHEKTLLTPAHLFRVASLSKMATAIAIMQLVEKRKLELTDRVGAILPELSSNADLSQVTIQQLLSHGSGMFRDGYGQDFWQGEGHFPTGKKLLSDVIETSLVYPPGEERFKYSNMDYGLLGQVIERITKASYRDHIIENVVNPLGLTNTGPEPDATAYASMATGYEVDTPITHMYTAALAPATGFYSTPEDLCRLGMAYLGDTLLRAESKEIMEQPLWRIGNSDKFYGLGIKTNTCSGMHCVEHGGGCPGFGVTLRMVPETQLVIAVAVNESNNNAPDAPKSHESLNRGVLALLHYEMAVASKKPLPDLALPYLGRYHSRLRGDFDIVWLGGRLVGLSPAAEDPISLICPIDITEGGELKVSEDSSPFDNIREPIRVAARDTDGKVATLYWGSEVMHQVKPENPEEESATAVSTVWRSQGTRYMTTRLPRGSMFVQAPGITQCLNRSPSR